MACLPVPGNSNLEAAKSPYSFTGAIERTQASFEVRHRQGEDGMTTKHGVHSDEALSNAKTISDRGPDLRDNVRSPLDQIELRVRGQGRGKGCVRFSRTHWPEQA